MIFLKRILPFILCSAVAHLADACTQILLDEAVQLSKPIGKPVKVIWTREDDTEQGPFRPMTFSALKAGLTSDGKAMAFQHKVISPTIGTAKIMIKQRPTAL